jgi:hypothetical protein
MNTEQLTREFHEAHYAYARRLAEETAKLEHIRDTDVRSAKAQLAVPEDVGERYREATIALEAHRADLNERWIVAHEELNSWRNPTKAAQ